MNKKQILESIEHVRQIHKTNLQHIDFCLKGMPLKERPISPDPTTCGIHQWFIDEAQTLIPFLGAAFLKELTALHEQWHDEYAKIFSIYYPNDKGNDLFSKLFKSKRKTLSQLEQERVRSYYNDLQQTSELFFHKLNRLERRIQVVSFD